MYRTAADLYYLLRCCLICHNSVFITGSRSSRYNILGPSERALSGCGMHLEEVAVGTECLGRESHSRHELAVAARGAVGCTGTLHGVGAVHDHRRRDGEHVGNVAEIDDQIVVAEAVAALGEPDFGSAGFERLFVGIAHVGARKELRFLDIDGFAGLRRGHQQIGLPAEESGNLQARRPPWPAGSACQASWMSVRSSSPHLARTSASICNPLSMPGPRNDPSDVRLALSNEALKMMRVPRRRLMAVRRSATVSSNSADSMTQGPAMNFIIGKRLKLKGERHFRLRFSPVTFHFEETPRPGRGLRGCRSRRSPGRRYPRRCGTRSQATAAVRATRPVRAATAAAP